MADALDTPTIAILVVAILVAVLTFFELRFLRKSSKARRIRAARRLENLSDDAHNALLTTKAIQSALARGGVRSEEADALIREAQMAQDRRNYRVVLELTTKAKERLMAAKAAQAAKGDLQKLESAVQDSDELTTKEMLQKEFPPNLAQSKFAMSLAESAIDSGRSVGRDVSQAEALLAGARARFDAKDYTGALAAARLAQRSAEGQAVEMPAPSRPTGEPVAVPLGATCPTCGTSLREDDTFCRKCGTKVGPRPCPSCGADLLADDLFCRKCGARVVA